MLVLVLLVLDFCTAYLFNEPFKLLTFLTLSGNLIALITYTYNYFGSYSAWIITFICYSHYNIQYLLSYSSILCILVKINAIISYFYFSSS